jgi:hypothetical protein
VDRGHTFVLVPIFDDFSAVEVPPVRKDPGQNKPVRQECAISGKVVEGGSGTPVIDEKPDCVCDDQGPYANSQEVRVNEFMELGHTPRSIWASAEGGNRVQVPEFKSPYKTLRLGPAVRW